MQRDSVQPGPDLAFGLCCYAPFHNSWYGLLATAIWTIRLWVDAPQFAASGSGLGNGQTAWVIAIIAAMAVSTVVTAGAFTSGLRASRIRAS